MSDHPTTIEEVVEWFEPASDKERAYLKWLAESIVSRPNPFAVYAGDHANPSDAWNWMIDFSLVGFESRFGWVKRNGEFLPAGYSAHERLLYWLDLEPEDVEKLGWARLSQSGWQCAFRLTISQRRVIEARDYVVEKEKERLKPAWVAS